MAVSDNMVTAGDPLIVRCDAIGNGEIDPSEVIAAINECLFGGVGITSKDDVIGLINPCLYPGGQFQGRLVLSGKGSPVCFNSGQCGGSPSLKPGSKRDRQTQPRGEKL